MQNMRKANPSVPWENRAKSTALSDPKTWIESSTNCSNSNTLPHVFTRKNKLRFHLVSALLTISLMQLYGTTNAQRISINSNNSSIKQVFQQLEKQSGYSFFYKDIVIEKIKDTGIKLENGTLQQALDAILKPNGLDYEIVNKTVVIKPARKSLLHTAIEQQYITGKVVDEDGKPLAGVTLRLKSDTKKAVQTQTDGTFILPSFFGGERVLISILGFEAQEFIPQKSSSNIVIKLKRVEQKVDEVIVTGMMERKKETFTGATASFNTQELKAVSNTNVIQSLKTLDPSFLIMENNLKGGNPNALPTIELRGQTSVTTAGIRDEFSADPNQPLFILDGFETTLKTIVDLDINRIASVTLLKDAASTASYGSRASNGVVVVETIRPKAGELLINYTSDLNLEFPDISGYNMMNSAEKIEFERLSGRFTRHFRNDYPERQEELDSLYSFYQKEVKRGVDSYWLKDPLQNSFSQRHSLMVSGGENAITYSIGGDYRAYNGTMKGSGGKNWGTRLNLGYRAGKLNVVNQLYVNGYNSQESPYGDFSTWVNTNPYYEKKPASEKYLGQVVQYNSGISESIPVNIINPLYATILPNFDKTTNFSLTNNLKAIYQFNPDWRIEASLQVNKYNTQANKFVSPLDLSFEKEPILQRGSLYSKTNDVLAYTTNISLNYGKAIGKHLINGMLRTEFSDKNNKSAGFHALGFPSNSNGNARFAYGYTPNGRPEAYQSINRRNSLISSFNYSYDRRYNADISFTYDGTTAFGTNNVYSPFFSAGLSWNINNEKFIKEIGWIDLLRLRGNIGITGNQNFSSFSSISTYDYIDDFNYFGQGIRLSALGNPNLKWQNTTQTSLGLDANLFQNRFSLQINAYRKYTNPLVVGILLPPSTALSNYPINLGELTVDGLELISRYSPIFRPSERIVWTLGLTASTNKQTYSGFGNKMETLNKSLRESKSLAKYRDGGSPNDIWAVPSLGIDPATGNEMFRKKDGSYTFEYDWADEIVLGNTAPKFQGIVSSNISYKGFTMGLNFRYIINQDIFNTALFNKVENINWIDMVTKNQDKRALYSRWKESGDISEFRKIQLNDWNMAYNNSVGIDPSTKPSSRFIQTENTITLESASFGYEFRSSEWMKKARLSNIRFTGYMNDIFRISTVKRERGIEYPFSRSVSFSLTANFQ